MTKSDNSKTTGPIWGDQYTRSPYRQFKFQVERKESGGWKEFAGFTKVSGMSVELKTKTYEEGGVNSHVHQLPDQVEYSNLTLERGVTDLGVLGEWMDEVKAATDGTGEQFRKSPSGITFGPGGDWKKVTHQIPKPQAPKRHVLVKLNYPANKKNKGSGGGSAGNTGRSWLFANAFPVKFEAPDLDASSGDVATQTLELAFDSFTQGARAAEE